MLSSSVNSIYIHGLVAAETRYCTVSVSSGPQHIVDFGRTRQHSKTLGSRCGDKSRPWTVDALNGQRIVVSLIDFTTVTTATSTGKKLGRSMRTFILPSTLVFRLSVLDKRGI